MLQSNLIKYDTISCGFTCEFLHWPSAIFSNARFFDFSVFLPSVRLIHVAKMSL